MFASTGNTSPIDRAAAREPEPLRSVRLDWIVGTSTWKTCTASMPSRQHLAGEHDDHTERDVHLRMPEDVAQLLEQDRLVVLPAQRGDAHEVRFESFTRWPGRALDP